MTESPTKRPRTLGFSHTNNHSNTQLINQSIDQSLSYLMQLATPLFCHICSFIDLDHKCRTIPVLSRYVNDMFNQSLNQACKDPIDIHFCIAADENSSPNGPIVDCNALARSIGRLKYAKYVRSINADLTALQLVDSDCRDRLTAGLIDALKGSALQSLTLKELVYNRSIALARLVETLRTPSFSQLANQSNLQTLSVMCLKRHNASDDERLSLRGVCDWNSPEILDWSGLTNCRSLQSFKFGTDNANDHYFEHVMNVFEHIPDLSELDLEMQWAPSKLSVIEQKLRQPTYLPNLKTIRFGEPLPIASAISTIMRSTNKVRPIESLSIQMTPELNFNLFGSLRKLLFRLTITELNQFCTLSDDMMPHLQVCDMEISSMPVNSVDRLDLSELFMFLSKRSIEEIFLMVMSFGPVAMPPLSQEAIRAWSRMHLLKKISISTHSCIYLMGCLFDQVLCETNDLPEESWPVLESLTLSSVEIGDYVSLLAAAPSLKHFAAEGAPFAWTPILPIIASLCPKIETIKVSSKAKFDDLSTLQSDFEIWRPQGGYFKHLTTLHCWERISDEALHFLATKLGEAPLLSDFRCDTSCESKFRLMLKKPLHHLKALTSSERRLTRDLMYIDKPGSDRVWMFENAVSGHAVSEHSSIFRRSIDARGLSGRDLFFDQLSLSLTEEEMKGLAEWNSGDYTWRRPAHQWADDDDDDDDFDEWDEEDEEFDDDDLDDDDYM